MAVSSEYCGGLSVPRSAKQRFGKFPDSFDLRFPSDAAQSVTVKQCLANQQALLVDPKCSATKLTSEHTL
jgi:hypothetical protein